MPNNQETHPLLAEEKKIFVSEDTDMLVCEIQSSVWDIIEPSVWEDTVNYILPQFIEAWINWLSLDFQKITSNIEFKNFVETIFQSGYYFEEVDYKKLLAFSYDDGTYLKPESLKQKFAQKIKKMNPERVKLYKNFRIQKWQAEFMFDKSIFLQNEEKLENFNFDELVSVLWVHGIKYWLIKDDIIKAMNAKESYQFIIAKELIPIDGKDASKEMVDTHIIMDLSPKEQNWIIKYKELKNKIPQVEAKVILFKKTPLQNWQDGVDIGWNVLEQRKLKDIDLNAISWEWTYVTVIDWSQCLCSAIKWYLLEDRKTHIFSVTKKIPPLKSDINTSTGSLEILWYEFKLMWNITHWFSLTGNFLNIAWNIYGSAISKWWHILIDWDIIWVSWDTYSGDNNGYVENENWDIKMNGRLISRANIIARKWKIDFSFAKNIEFSKIIWNEIQANYAINSIIIGNNIKIKKIKNCIIIGTNIEIWEIEYDEKQNWGNEITIIIKWNIVKMKKQIKDFEIQISWKQIEIDKIWFFNNAIKSIFTKMGLKLDFDNGDIFDSQTKPYLEKYKLVAPKLKDKSYLLSLDTAKKQQLAQFILVVNKINEWIAYWEQVKKYQSEIVSIQEESKKIQNAIDNITSQLSCNIWKIGDTLLVKKVELEYSFNFLDVESAQLIKLLSNNLSLTEILRSPWKKEAYTFSLE